PQGPLKRMGMLGETSLRAQRQAHALAIKPIYDLIRPSLALRHGINANQLRRWMSVVAVTAPPPPQGHIELEVFGARLKLHGAVDGQRLRVVLHALARRS
ncbi:MULTISPECIES: hypothetical protein, partial [unclassified Variovorax]|uniref:hypothetical protein n=1 Tax=unclassified Variovorax TaxID=663243 RepID=UPI003F44C5A5